MHPNNTDPSSFVILADIIPDIIQEIRYSTTYNFVGERIDGYEEPVALLTKQAAEALKKANDYAVQQGYRFRVFDAYRPQMAVDHFVRWAQDLNATSMKPYFYPEVDKSILFESHYIAYKSGHTRGSTIDLTLFDIKTGKDLDMGCNFDYFGEISHPDYQNLTKDQLANREKLREIMMSNGFKPIQSEWWHFVLENEPFPDTYFNFPVCTQLIKKNHEV